MEMKYYIVMGFIAVIFIYAFYAMQPSEIIENKEIRVGAILALSGD